MPRPGVVYVMTSHAKPGQCKLGRAARQDRRVRAGRTWLKDLQVHAQFAFLHSPHAERLVHSHFAPQRADESEWFHISPEEACAHLTQMQAVQAPTLAKFGEMVRLAGELGLAPSKRTKAPNSALEAVLAWRLPRSAVTAGEAIAAVLQRTPNCTVFATKLVASGFGVSLAESRVFLDLTEGTALVHHLDKAIGKGRWEPLLKDVGAFTREGQPVTLAQCLRECLSDPKLLAKKFSEQHRRLIPSA